MAGKQWPGPPAAASAAAWASPSGDTWYAPVPPPGELHGDLATGWSARMAGEYRLVPDGCVEVLWLATGAVVVCGPETAAWSTVLPSSAVDAVGVRFRPGRAAAVLGLDVAAVRDRRVPLADVVGGRADRLLRAEICAAAPADRLGVLFAHAHKWISVAPQQDPVVDTVAAMLTADPGSTVGALAEAAGHSGRHLRRRCTTGFGYGPATLRRILRLQRFLRLARRGDGTDLATLAVLAGYTDQPHLSRDCREIAGVSPGSLAGRRVRSVHDSDRRGAADLAA